MLGVITMKQKEYGKNSISEEKQIEVLASLVNNPQQATKTDCDVSTSTVKKIS